MANTSFIETMEKEVEEVNNPNKHRSMIRNPDWLDLPEPVATNIVLEHLELVDYIVFSAVCKKWQSIQKEHRNRYSPYPPPSPLTFPWLLCGNCEHNRNDEDRSIFFHLPDKRKSYNIPFPKTGEIFSTKYSHGWLLLHTESDAFHPQVMHIFNPITGVQIKIPLAPILKYKSDYFNTHISSTPTNPDCTIFIINLDGIVYLYRVNDEIGWKKISCFRERYGIQRAVLCNNKIYHMVTDTLGSICMIDTLLSDPVEQTIEMDCSEIPLHIIIDFDLVDFFGELVTIITVFFTTEDNYDFRRFHLYRADFLTSKWTRMETLGDSALFYGTDGIFALPAVEVGCKKNVIYFAKHLQNRRVAWRALDVSTKNWIDGPPLTLPSSGCHSNCSLSWFLPTLDYFDVAKINGTC